MCPFPKYRTYAVLLATAVLLVACAGAKTFSSGQQLLAAGQIEEGLKTLQKAVDENPRNQEYRTYYYRQREVALSQLLAQADEARLVGDLAAAEHAYRRV